MTFKVKGGDFSRKLGMIQGIAEKRTTMPILSHVLIRATEKGLLLVATDLENTISVLCDATVEGKMELAVPARLLFDLVKEFGEDEEISVEEVENNWIEVTVGAGTYKIAGLPAQDFPKVPEVSSDETFSVPSEKLGEMISRTIFSVSRDEMRRSLSGIYFEKRGDEGLRLVATDGHRLSFADHKMEGVALSENVLVPQKAVAEIRKLLGMSEEVSVGCSENFFVFAVDGENLVLLSRTVEADFPDYMQVVPASTKNEVKLDARKLLLTLRAVSIFSADNVKGGGKFIKMELGEGSLIVESSSPSLGGGQDSIPIGYSGEKVELGFNFEYFQDFLEAVGEPEISLGFSGPKNPVLLVPASGDDYVNVIMPMEL